ncbi:RNA polymerase, sigma 54 subunit, RpoN/SigL [Cyclonatronum proteinivorum]|uniref:RNA polymerase, sigma 54 subunit, RpoN/SigL n=1 Tax=Cyclonatronum proteinivorum TaxID=1457365 RepID=A0A345UM96_9BACT|nr:RNA polymerase factor sigma-54 [Cyclonatronum proteinivorum]AXJ01598.1 RNA polymerase, sigma 54 subunit, RpoN/SigL [Cyclonatronum proteinivorum]
MITQKQRQGQFQKQVQTQQQKLSPQQIQYIKMLQMSTQHIEQRIKEEMESNPALEDADSGEDLYGPDDNSYDEPAMQDTDTDATATEAETDAPAVDDDLDVDWDAFHSDNSEGYSSSTTWNPDAPDWMDIPAPYRETQLEKLEQQVLLLDLSEKENLIADQILGSIDDDGYFRRALSAVADSIAFQHGMPVHPDEVAGVLERIQRLDPPGIAARNLRECLSIQLQMLDPHTPGLQTAKEIIGNHWEDFEKKHFEKIMRKMDVSDDVFREAYDCLRMLDPKPGSFETAAADAGNFIVPDFEVYYEPAENDTEKGGFVIKLNRRNLPDLVVSKSYEQMIADMAKRKEKNKEQKEAQLFLRSKIESARWFIEMLYQRQQTLLAVMQTIVNIQESFFKSGVNIKPMILKDVADVVSLDVSTISRVVNGKYVQTPFGVYELRYFFNEGITTQSGEEVSNLEVKNILADIIENEPKANPLSDQKLTDILKEKGFIVARRTVTKYREQLRIPTARLRKSVI